MDGVANHLYHVVSRHYCTVKHHYMNQPNELKKSVHF